MSETHDPELVTVEPDTTDDGLIPLPPVEREFRIIPLGFGGRAVRMEVHFADGVARHLGIFSSRRRAERFIASVEAA